MKIHWHCFCLTACILAFGAFAVAAQDITPLQLPTAEIHQPSAAVEIGRQIFVDTSLSRPAGQGCVSCHQPDAAFADPRPVSPGAVSGRSGKRNSPSLMYAAFIPGFAYDEFFTKHDGRARDLFDQVRQPFLDPNEMNLPDQSASAARLREASYAADLKRWTGEPSWSDGSRLAYHAYRALVEFLKEPMFRRFDARIDDFLAGDKTAFNESERRGLEVFRGAGKCVDCHFLEPNHWSKPLLSDFGYDNLGVPSRGEKDPGLGGRTGNPQELGQFRAPGLENLELTAPYMHNGSIATLREVIKFYSKRDLQPKR